MKIRRRPHIDNPVTGHVEGSQRAVRLGASRQPRQTQGGGKRLPTGVRMGRHSFIRKVDENGKVKVIMGPPLYNHQGVRIEPMVGLQAAAQKNPNKAPHVVGHVWPSKVSKLYKLAS